MIEIVQFKPNQQLPKVFSNENKIENKTDIKAFFHIDCTDINLFGLDIKGYQILPDRLDGDFRL